MNNSPQQPRRKEQKSQLLTSLPWMLGTGILVFLLPQPKTGAHRHSTAQKAVEGAQELAGQTVTAGRRVTRSATKTISDRTTALLEQGAQAVHQLQRHEKHHGRSSWQPWGLIVLAAGGYAVWRNENARRSLRNLVKELESGAQKNLKRLKGVAQHANEAVQSRASLPEAAKVLAGDLTTDGHKKPASNAESPPLGGPPHVPMTLQELPKETIVTPAGQQDTSRRQEGNTTGESSKN